jgi:hypothetical protein
LCVNLRDNPPELAALIADFVDLSADFSDLIADFVDFADYADDKASIPTISTGHIRRRSGFFG